MSAGSFWVVTMKKFLLSASVCVLALSFYACSDSDDKDDLPEGESVFFNYNAGEVTCEGNGTTCMVEKFWTCKNNEIVSSVECPNNCDGDKGCID